MQQGVDVANQNIGNQEQATAKGVQAIQGNAARAQAGGQGLYGGGRGLALMRSAALQTGQAEGAYQSQQSMAHNALLAEAALQQQKLAQGQTEIAGEKQKILQAQAGRQAKLNSALASAQSIINAEKGTIYTNEADKIRMVNRIRQEVLANETDPQVINAVKQLIYGLGSGSYDIKGSLET